VVKFGSMRSPNSPCEGKSEELAAKKSQKTEDGADEFQRCFQEANGYGLGRRNTIQRSDRVLSFASLSLPVHSTHSFGNSE